MPGYWMDETSGVLRPAVEALLANRLTEAQVPTIRAYLRQWIEAPGFVGAEVEDLRSRVGGLRTPQAVTAWINDAVEAGIDPI